MTSREERLHHVVADRLRDPVGGPAVLIDAACTALADGLDSTALRELAGASERDRSGDVEESALTALDELGIPRPGAVPLGFRVAPGGGVVARSGTDTLRLGIAPTSFGVEVLVHVNGIDIAHACGGFGVDPRDLLVPDNRLAVDGTVRIAFLNDGHAGQTDVTVIRDGDLVHWEWSNDVPMNRGVTFTATEYDAELARVTAGGDRADPGR